MAVRLEDEAMPNMFGVLDAGIVAAVLALIVYSWRFGNPFGRRPS
jgi:hypothetical protein